MILFEETLLLSVNKAFYFVPLGDVHHNVADCDRPLFQRTVKKIKALVEEGHIVRVIGTGDYTDPLSTSERAAIIGAKGGIGLHDSTLEALDEFFRNIADRFIEEVWPIKHCFAGLLEGHHYGVFSHKSSGTLIGHTTTEYIAAKLGCRYLGTITLNDFYLKPMKQGPLFRLGTVCHHGWGAARTRGARVNQRERFGQQFPEAHIVCLGHDHDKFVVSDQKLIRDTDSKDSLSVLQRYYVATGSYLRGYQSGRERGSYVEERGLPPAELGSPMIRVWLEKIGVKWKVFSQAIT